jgi:phosphopantothenoylcysteine synthetase/decarboxylase
MSKSNKILFQLSGSIACFKACAAISTLVQKGFEVQTVITDSTLEFIGAATLEGLTNRPVLQNLYQPGNQMDHIHLARESDLMILCPATAHTINRLASGLADDLIGALFLANNFRTEYWIVPAMNVEMYNHPASIEARNKLASWGAKVLEGEDGLLACGEYGKGRMLEAQELVKLVELHFKKKTKAKK